MKKLLAGVMLAVSFSVSAMTTQEAVIVMEDVVKAYVVLETGEEYQGEMKTVCYPENEKYQCATNLVEQQIVLHAICENDSCQPMGYDEVESE